MASRTRIYPRRFDWAEAQRRFGAGESLRALAAEYGVSYTAVYNATHPEKYARSLAVTREWQRSGTCPECGGRMSRAKGYSRCVICASRARATSVREQTLRCSRCRKWLPDEEFPHNSSAAHRRGRHAACRACNTLEKRAYRERQRELV